MRVTFDDGTLLLENVPETVPYAEWDDRAGDYRAHAHHYRDILAWAQADAAGQTTLQHATAPIDSVEDTARAYRELQLTPAVAIEPRDYQQAALTACTDHNRLGSVTLQLAAARRFLPSRPSLTPESVRSSSSLRPTS